MDNDKLNEAISQTKTGLSTVIKALRETSSENKSLRRELDKLKKAFSLCQEGNDKKIREYERLLAKNGLETKSQKQKRFYENYPDVMDKILAVKKSLRIQSRSASDFTNRNNIINRVLNDIEVDNFYTKKQLVAYLDVLENLDIKKVDSETRKFMPSFNVDIDILNKYNQTKKFLERAEVIKNGKINKEKFYKNSYNSGEK